MNGSVDETMRRNHGTSLERLRAEAAPAFLARAVRGLPRHGQALISVPAPRVPLERMWDADAATPAVLWTDPRGRSLAGVGAAVTVGAEGDGRFEMVSTAAAGLASATAVVHDAMNSPLVPALLGGFAFAAGRSDPCWGPFGDACFVLPRWTFEHHPGRTASLTLALGRDERPEPAQILREATGILDRLVGPTVQRPAALPLKPCSMGLAEWSALVEDARAAIAQGALRKVVLARRFDAELPPGVELRSLLAALAATNAGIYRFAFRFGGTMFLGASPELLVARRGRRVESEAVAGSVALRPGDGGRGWHALLADAKQLEEHAVVTRALEAALAPLCTTLASSNRPRVRHLRHVAHLCSAFTGDLREELDVVQIAARLHPTPAVGGEPRDEALAFIAAREPVGRGWYAGPVGLVDAHGDGAFAVALRGALIAGTAVRVWAGAGIIGASEPQAEYDETALKQHAALAALGLLQ
jgi:isochorismate synthase